MKTIDIIAIVYLAWNLVAFSIVGIDKLKAKKGLFRISEVVLFLSAFLLGSVGVVCGMLIFHHKVSKANFRFLIPLFLIINLVGLYFGIKYLFI